MRLALDTRTPLVQRLPELDLDCLRALGRKHVVDRQLFLTHLLGMSYERRRPHSGDPNADSFDRDFLVRGLRVSPRGKVYTRLLEPFYEFPNGNRGYSKERGATKAYRLRPTVVAALHAVYRSDEPLPIMAYDEDENQVPLDKLGANGLPQHLANRIPLPSVLRLSVGQVDHALGRVEGWIGQLGETMYLDPAKPNSTTLSEARSLLVTCRKWAISLGGLPNLYREQSHGRLGPSGFHLIQLPNRIRELLFEGSDLAYYDVTSCHWSIFQSLGRALGFSTPKVDSYVNRKSDWHGLWAGLTGYGDRSALKAIAASWLTGGTLSSSPRTESGNKLGSRGIEALRQHGPTMLLYREVKDGMKQIIRETLKSEVDGDHNIYINAVGQWLRLQETPSDYGRLCSHALTGYEQFAIREMCEQIAGLQAIIYDGFIAAPQPVGPVEEHVRKRSKEALGVTLDVRLKTTDLSERIPDLQHDSGDF